MLRSSNVVLVLCSLLLACSVRAQHTRVFATALANDSAGAFMGGSSNGSGVYQSDDTGQTWKHIGWKNVKAYGLASPEASYGRVLYLAAGNGVMRSTDFGEHWKLLTNWKIAEVLDVADDPHDSSYILAATAHGLWCSTNYGTTWQRRDKGMTSHYVSRIAFDQFESSNHVVAGTEGGIVESSNKGKSWRITYNGRIRDLVQLTNDWIAPTDGTGLLTWSSQHENTFDYWHEADTLWAVAGYDLEHFTWAGSGVTKVHRRSFTGESSNIDHVSTLLRVGNIELAGRIDGGVYRRTLDQLDFRPSGLARIQISRLVSCEIR